MIGVSVRPSLRGVVVVVIGYYVHRSGQNSVADVALAQRPMIVIPQRRLGRLRRSGQSAAAGRSSQPRRGPHPARPHPALGGFRESYRGYGGEDIDFGQLAKLGSIPLRWIGGVGAFHQYHRVSDPPVEHLDDILRNAEVFHETWGWCV